MAHSTRIPPLRFSNNVKGHFLSTPLRLDQGLHYRTMLPACVFARPDWRATQSTPPPRIAWRPSPTPVDQNPRPKHASCIQSSVRPPQIRSRDGRVGWRDVALAMLCSEPQILWWRPLWIKWLCGTHLSIGGRSSWRSQLLRKRHVTRRTCLDPQRVPQPRASGGCPSAGIYTGPFVYSLGPASGVQRAFSVPSCFLLHWLWRHL